MRAVAARLVRGAATSAAAAAAIRRKSRRSMCACLRGDSSRPPGNVHGFPRRRRRERHRETVAESPTYNGPMRTLGTLAVAVLLIIARPATQPPRSVLVFAAVSLKGALDEVGALVAQRTGVALKASYAATSLLAKQIEEGAPADIFVAADEQWMDYLAERRLIAPASR